jgi:hypothetical protein
MSRKKVGGSQASSLTRHYKRNIHDQFLSVQITAARHAIKIACRAFVAAVGNTCSHILVLVGDRACKSGNTVS